MATRQELSEFLASVERRAFKQALFSVRNEESALDLVQDAMMKLAEKYADRPAEEFPMLFQRILQNATLSFFRRQKTRLTWTSLFSSFFSDESSSDSDIIESLEFSAGLTESNGPAEILSRQQIIDVLEDEIARLPVRQREAFLMRYWEDMDVAQTAAVMGCSEGTVKTHCSRAAHALSTALKARGVEL